VKEMASSPAGYGGRSFPETSWSQIVACGSSDVAHRRSRLDRFVRNYWRPVYYYIRAVRPRRQDAEDLTQEFFATLLARVDFGALTPDRGSFRGFLKTALFRFVISAERKEGAASRKESLPAFPFHEAESTFPSSSGLTPSELFDVEWARRVLAEAMQKLHVDLVAEGKALEYELFRAYVLEPREGESYESLALQHGIKVDDVGNHLRRAKARARAIVKAIVRDYTLPGEDIEGELRLILTF
jgi:RNA polymerase sigma-70 factor (ECF subfamily)